MADFYEYCKQCGNYSFVDSSKSCVECRQNMAVKNNVEKVKPKKVDKYEKPKLDGHKQLSKEKTILDKGYEGYQIVCSCGKKINGWTDSNVKDNFKKHCQGLL